MTKCLKDFMREIFSAHPGQLCHPVGPASMQRGACGPQRPWLPPLLCGVWWWVGFYHTIHTAPCPSLQPRICDQCCQQALCGHREVEKNQTQALPSNHACLCTDSRLVLARGWEGGGPQGNAWRGSEGMHLQLSNNQVLQCTAQHVAAVSNTVMDVLQLLRK